MQPYPLHPAVVMALVLFHRDLRRNRTRDRQRT